MGAPIVIFFWLIVFAIFAALWAGSLWLFIAGRRRKLNVTTWIGGVPLALLSVGAVAALSWTVYVTTIPTLPADAYQRAFGVAPATDVTGLKSRDVYSSLGRSWQFYIRFKAAPKTLNRITANGWTKQNAKQWAKSGGETALLEDSPAWWRPKKKALTQVLERKTDPRDKSKFEAEELVYDAATGEVFYYLSGFS